MDDSEVSHQLIGAPMIFRVAGAGFWKKSTVVWGFLGNNPQFTSLFLGVPKIPGP